MLIEIATSLTAASILGVAQLKKEGSSGDDAKKIKQIADAVGLKKNGQSIRIHRKYRPKNKHYTEYVYQIPLGLALEDFQEKHKKFEDGLNNKQTNYFLSFKDLKKIDWKELRKINSLKELPEQFKRIFGEKQLIRKSVEMSFDGMLKIKVYDRLMPKYLPFKESIWEQCKKWHIPIGETKEGLYFIQLDDGHAVVAGTTRYGKTTFMHLLINTFIYLHPNEVEFSLIDLKSGLSFQRYKDCKQVINMAEDLASAHSCFKEVLQEMKSRKALFKKLGIEKIQDIKQPMTRHYIIIDEASNLDYRRMELKTKKDIEQAKLLYEQCKAWMKMIACEAASLGIYLVFSTQYPTTEILDSQVKANTTTKICYRLDTGTQSTVVLDRTGAEEITLKGRAIVRTPDGTTEVQSYFLSDKQINEVITPNIIIKPRKENEDAKSSEEGTEDRQRSLVLKKTRLS
ncbi:FtsK/SpoIIIE domain-containing protein [Priestia megaterium]|uniref:FtsK/SpoIIIE domain-containing protein n=1 Tax=Priestia megaterium TaxID=1404 RepID=UPI002D810CB9|nr:FtsK/SpoIIIE domain-containing protein [Priestia megaterium]MEB4856071.1 FtsK/SpoIIIE domain-containing protein [Priestia megaterium]